MFDLLPFCETFGRLAPGIKFLYITYKIIAYSNTPPQMVQWCSSALQLLSYD